jgi:hypothetical protein
VGGGGGFAACGGVGWCFGAALQRAVLRVGCVLFCGAKGYGLGSIDNTSLVKPQRYYRLWSIDHSF